MLGLQLFARSGAHSPPARWRLDGDRCQKPGLKSTHVLTAWCRSPQLVFPPRSAAIDSPRLENVMRAPVPEQQSASAGDAKVLALGVILVLDRQEGRERAGGAPRG